jgi:hypothetical protein
MMLLIDSAWGEVAEELKQKDHFHNSMQHNRIALPTLSSQLNHIHHAIAIAVTSSPLTALGCLASSRRLALHQLVGRRRSTCTRFRPPSQSLTIQASQSFHACNTSTTPHSTRALHTFQLPPPLARASHVLNATRNLQQQHLPSRVATHCLTLRCHAEGSEIRERPEILVRRALPRSAELGLRARTR